MNVAWNILPGKYENHLYNGGGKNDWHHAELTEGDAPNEIIWINWENVSWSIFMMDDLASLASN
eukprot:3784664-Ditylum_brightwellii.AAC.1